LIGCIGIGLTAADMENYTTGHLLDVITTYSNLQSGSEDKEDLYYRQLKEMEPDIRAQYTSGALSEADYVEYMRALDGYESDLGGI